MTYSSLPEKQGLYDPALEKDSCGIGFIAHIRGEKSHQIIRDGLGILKKLSHRGACGSDPLSGDGAGILIQLPHEFFKKHCVRQGIQLPEPGKYGAGQVFLPPDKDQSDECIRIMESMIADAGLRLLGWREVPRDNSTIGVTACLGEPLIRQVFIGLGDKQLTQIQLERKLYVVRKRAALAILNRGLNKDEKFYVCSLSTRTFLYKGQFLSEQLEAYYKDFTDTDMISAMALVHSRYSTNTFPSWSRAQPLHFLAHNGEINTIRGNVNWLKAREALFESDVIDDIKKTLPVIMPGGSDSMDFDMTLELLILSGRSLPHAMMMMIPEPWSGHETMDKDKKGFYEFHASMMEPWDGPASMAFSDGEVIGAVLDRNGLRPSRYVVTKNDLVIMASEVGVVPVDDAAVLQKGRLQPGKIFLVDMKQGRIITDEELKAGISTRKPYAEWVKQNQINLADLPEPDIKFEPDTQSLFARQQAFGYTGEDLKIVMAPMVESGDEAVGSMGNDAALAVLSDRPQLLFNYFKQLFAQVTNPAIDSIREELVMSMELTLGKELNLLSESPAHCAKLKIQNPILTYKEIETIRKLNKPGFKSAVLSTLFPVSEGEGGLEKGLEIVCQKASEAIRGGATILILSDRGVNAENAAIPSLLATAAVHHHLLRELTRTSAGIVIETGEAREMMHFALLIGYGASAVHPYLAYETVSQLVHDKLYVKHMDVPTGLKNYIKSTKKGLFKIIAKMGISTLQSYRGAQIFEAVGLNASVIDRYFTGTPSRIGGVGIEVIALETLMRHREAFSGGKGARTLLDPGGNYHWRRGGERHMYDPNTIAMLQHAVRSNEYPLFKKFTRVVDEYSTKECTLRGLLKIKKGNPIPIEEVEPVEEITKRFCTGAMSIGSISREAHETLAIAMNRLGGRSNTGEGGEDPSRYVPDTNGDSRRSRIKQVASGRFGVNSNYLANADELQIKVSQGAKPGEGGQLPGHKVTEYIAKIRHSTPGVSLISPPPHHDIYSIEDLQQLIFDLHNANPHATVSVKLVAEVGVGTVAAGVSKAHADGVLISGHDGGTGASPQTSIKHAGLPWELGLSETQQVLVMNDLRGRIRVQVDGHLKTGRDVVIGGLLGADEFGFATTALVSLGCILMRKCHLNTCSVGVATQDPELRKRFSGKPDYVVNFFRFVAQEVRELMAEMGIRKFDDLIGSSNLLEMQEATDHWKSKGLDYSKMLFKPVVPPTVAVRNMTKQDHGEITKVLDYKLIEDCRLAIEKTARVDLRYPIGNTDRTTGAMLSYHISKKYGEKGLPDHTINIYFKGSAGQSFGAFLAPGAALTLEGDANDYLGKGLSGGTIYVFPPKESTFIPEENQIVGNVVLYGAISGKVFLRGRAGERFAIRNSGSQAVVEGIGDHGCEYMTGGAVVVLGDTGRNFAAGMSGGIAYIWDHAHKFKVNCNPGMVDLHPVEEAEDIDLLKKLLEEHCLYTQSSVARRILDEWRTHLPQFVKVYPRDYRKVAEARKGKKEPVLEEVA